MSEPYSDSLTDSGPLQILTVRYVSDDSVVRTATVDQVYTSSVKMGINPTKQSRVKPPNLLGGLTGNGPYSKFEATPYSFEKETEGDPYGSPSRYDTNKWFLHSIPVLPAVPQQIDGMRTKHLLRVRRLSTDYASDIAEANKIADGFTGLAKQIPQIWKRVKGKSKRKISVCDAASANLATEFGIKPVVRSMGTSLDRIRGNVENSIKRVSTRSSKTIRGIVASDGSVWDFRISETWISYMELKNTIFQNTINYGSPLEALWENIPFSFVVDYGINIGDTIAAYGADRSLDHLGTVSTVRVSGKCKSIPPPNGDYKESSKGSGTYVLYVRRKHLDLPNPDLPRIDPSTSMRALSNAVSTLVAVNKGCKNRR